MQDTGCLGLVHGDDVGWEVGRGFMFGSSCTPVVDSCQCMAKPIQYCKVKNKKIKIKKKDVHKSQIYQNTKVNID